MNVYEKNGYDNRTEYLNTMATDYGIERNIVQLLADVLGETEDFDGLIVLLEDEADRRADEGEDFSTALLDNLFEQKGW